MKKGYLFVLPWRLEHAGGVNQVVINLLSSAKAKGLNASVFIDNWNDIAFRKTKKGDLTIRSGRLRSPLAKSIKAHLLYWLTLPHTLFRLAKCLDEENVVCVNLHYPTDSALTFVLLRKLGLFRGRLLLSLHGLDLVPIEASSDFSCLLWHFILKNSDALVTCSHALKSRLSAKFPDLLDQVKVIHNGFDILAFEAERDPQACLPAELVGTDFILNIGTYEHKKGQDVLIHAFRQISDAYPTLKLALIGGSGPVLDELRQLVETLGLKERIIFVIALPHDKIAPFLESAKFFVLPSRIEPFGIVILEAGAFGLPVIASRVGGIPEIVSSPDLGILVEPNNASTFAEAMLKVLKNPEMAKEMGGNLRRHVLNNFTWNQAIDRYLELLSPQALEK